MAKILGVKFKNTAKIYYFAPQEGVDDYEEKSGVIVETAKGLEYGTVVFGVKEVDDKEIVHPLKPVIRKATEKDEKMIRENEKKIPEALEFAAEKIAELKLNMKLIGCEYAFALRLIIELTLENWLRFWLQSFTLELNLGKLVFVTRLRF